MFGNGHSTKLASLIQLCFAAGIVFASGSAFAESCNLDPSQVCTQPGPGSGLPTLCEQYPTEPQCLGGAGGGGGGTYVAVALTDVLGWATAVPRRPDNPVQASCASDYNTRLASAVQDVSSWWPYFNGAWTIDRPGKQVISVTYSNGQREIFAFLHGPYSSNAGVPMGFNGILGAGVLASLDEQGPYGTFGSYEVANGGVWGGGPGLYELCQ
ncbi:hypothetical protein ACVWWJ_003442 [Luteibacter sp. HA06]